MRRDELEMRDHGMVGEAELADDADALRLGLHTLELNSRGHLAQLDAVEHAVEIEVPPGAAELAVGDPRQAYRLLLRHRFADAAILD